MCTLDFLIIKHTLVDHMFLKCNKNYLLDNNTEAGVLQIDISDHFPTITAIPLNDNLYSTIDQIYRLPTSKR